MTDDTNDLPLTAKIIIWLAVIIWAIWYMSGGEERRKEWEERNSGSNLFCNPVSGVCVDDPNGKKRQAWEDALRRAAEGYD